MSPDDKRSDDYWMGVRDALRMVDSFMRWSRNNKDRAKSMDEFIHDGLVAAAKRCESCLHKQLGISFNDEDEITEDSVAEVGPEETSVSLGPSESEVSDDTYTDSTPPEIVLDTECLDQTGDISVVVETETSSAADEDSEVLLADDSGISIDTIGEPEGSLDEGALTSAESRDFSSDFELVEPDSLIIESSSNEKEPANSSVLDEEGSEGSSYEDEADESSEDSYVPEPPAEVKEDIAVEHPRYVWEEAPPRAAESDDYLEDGESNTSEREKTDDKGSPPPPPPPPDGEESDEERRRRARRLFFGT
jgi:hypothetical protein